MMEDQVDLSIVIVNWNTRGYLSRCLRSAYDTVTSLKFEVFVVDNASQDGSVGMVRAQFPQVRLIENEVNVGFARANNQAIRGSRGRHILLLNPDTFVMDDAIERMVAFMDSHPDVGAAGCRLYYPSGELQPSCTVFPTLSTEFYRFVYLDRSLSHSSGFAECAVSGRYSGDEASGGKASEIEVDAVLGAFMIVRRQAIEQVGLLDESFFMYSEEVDWCYRIKRGGWRICHVPSAEAIHVGGASTDQVKDEMVFELYGSRIAFFRKHYAPPVVLLLKLLLAGVSISRLVLLPVRYLLSRETRVESRQKWQGYWRLLRYLRSL